MGLYNNILENFFIPFSDIIEGTNKSNAIRLLRKSQWWSRQKLIAYQNKKLRQLIHHSYHNVPYYNELFNKIDLSPDDIRTVTDLEKIPILDKETIRRNYPDKMVSRNLPKKTFIKAASSGSTGQPLEFFISKNSQSFIYASTVRGWSWMGYVLGDSFVKLSQNPRPSNRKLQDLILRCHYLHSRQLVEENFDSIINEIIDFNPKYMRGYPDPLYFLSKYCEKSKKSKISLDGISTTGNTLYMESRNQIEKTFSTKISDSYGNEIGACLFECETHNFYHLSMEQVVGEIISRGEKVNSGERGKLILTDLTNYSMPFIRYDTQDLVVKGSPCSCGRKLDTISSIDGRDNDILVTRSEKYLIVHNFTGFFQSNEEVLGSVDNFQVVQDKIDEISINLVTNSNFTDKIKKEIKNYWEDYIGPDVNIQINLVPRITPTKSGKRRFLVRNFDYNF